MSETQKKLFKRDYSHELLSIAKGDGASAKALAREKGFGRPENIVFLVQQSVEKALKAVLNYHQIPFPLVHDLGILVALLPDEKAPPGGFDLAQLNPYASVRRYEEPTAELTDNEIEASLVAMDAVLVWAEKQLKET